MVVSLTKGNKKLGKIPSFSLPAGSTCPGQSTVCAGDCYAMKGYFVYPSVQRSYERNLEATKREDFVEAMTQKVKARGPAVVRTHVSGDFYSGEYVRKWVLIAQACPETIFYAYTRSWRVKEIRKELHVLARLGNVKLWYSADHETGLPIRKPDSVRTAWMQTAPDDLPTRKALLFRTENLRATVQKRVSLPVSGETTLTCPAENGVTKTTCEKCSICWEC